MSTSDARPGSGGTLVEDVYTPMVSEPNDYEVLPDRSLRAIEPARELQPA